MLGNSQRNRRYCTETRQVPLSSRIGLARKNAVEEPRVPAATEMNEGATTFRFPPSERDGRRKRDSGNDSGLDVQTQSFQSEGEIAMRLFVKSP